MEKITVQDNEIRIITNNNDDYISLTDMAKSQLQEHIIFRWLSLKSTIEYLGEWEMLYNPNFNCTEFGIIKIGIEEKRVRAQCHQRCQNFYDTKSIKSRYIILVFNDWLESTRKASFSRFSSEYKKRKPFFW